MAAKSRQLYRLEAADVLQQQMHLSQLGHLVEDVGAAQRKPYPALQDPANNQTSPSLIVILQCLPNVKSEGTS